MQYDLNRIWPSHISTYTWACPTEVISLLDLRELLKEGIENKNQGLSFFVLVVLASQKYGTSSWLSSLYRCIVIEGADFNSNN